MSREHWKPVPEYTGLYEVSDRGRVRSLDRYDRRGVFQRGVMLRLSVSPGGYSAANLCRAGRHRTTNAHRLVCTVFHGRPRPGQVVRHLNGNRQDNRAANLVWGSRQENARDFLRAGKGAMGSRHPHAKLTEAIVRAMRQGRYGRSTAVLARRFKVDAVVIREVLRGTRWTHVQPAQATWPLATRDRLDAATVRKIRQGRYGTNQSEIARTLGLTSGTVWQAVQGNTWAHVQPAKAVWLDAPVAPPAPDAPKREGAYARGDDHGRAMLTAVQVQELRQGAYGTVPAKIARRFGCSVGAVYQVASGRTWGHVQPAVADWWESRPRQRGTRGEAHHKARLTAVQVVAIRRGRYGQNSRVIAERLRVSKSAVEHVLYGRAWAHLDPPKAVWLQKVAG